jgi:hypothetical protein
VREGPWVGLQLNGLSQCPSVGQHDGPHLHLDHKLLGAQKNGAWSSLVLLIILKSGQPEDVFLPGATSVLGRPILSFNNLASASGLEDLLGVPGPLGTFIFPVSFLTTVGTLVLL